MAALDCSHLYCRGCWDGYLSAMVEGGVQSIKCPNTECQIVVSEYFVTYVWMFFRISFPRRQLLSNPNLIRKYKILVSRAFVAVQCVWLLRSWSDQPVREVVHRNKLRERRPRQQTELEDGPMLMRPAILLLLSWRRP